MSDMLKLKSIILRRQNKDGSWSYPAPKAKIRSKTNYDQLETYRNLGFLVEIYGLDRENPAVRKACEYLFKFQTKFGDFRGIYGNQYTPNYSAAITELLVKAGYVNDPRIKKSFDWLISKRQDDGGWAIPFRTRGRKLSAISEKMVIEPDRGNPFSWFVTGVVLRAFASHPKYRKSKVAKEAGRLLLTKFFKPDNYPDRKMVYFWTEFSYPFWFTDLISALDSLLLLGFSKRDPSIKKAVSWLLKRREKDGMWRLKIVRNKHPDGDYLITQAIRRVFSRLQIE